MKLTRGRPAKNMQRLASKISDLQSLYQQQARRRQEDIVHLLSRVDLASVDDSILMGAFLFIHNKLTTKDPLVEDWNDTGLRFLRQPKSQNLSCFTDNATSQTTHRSPQKHPESRGESDGS
ncbi:MAG: hypothetical protein KBD36_06505 [Alphaproteobacteria bacterium]|nr:hypothetical protein [Alphaproteobacteria bacterium]